MSAAETVSPGLRWLTLALSLLLPSLIGPSRVHARELWANDAYSHILSLDSALKASWLLSRSPEDPFLFPERTSLTNLWRARLTAGVTLGPYVELGAAYEHRSRLASGAGQALAGGGILPPLAPAPYRIVSVEQALLDRAEVTHHHELDRAHLSLHDEVLSVTLGRQAVGLGRGVLFSAVDMFAPFSPLEVDREWRRGVDAARVEVTVSEQLSIDMLAVAERHFEDAALVARVRGYFGDVDGALIGGRRLEDYFIALVGSALLGDAELHGEAAAFSTDGNGLDGGFRNPDPDPGKRVWVLKALVGGSHQFDLGRGLRLVGEYHYNGFGLRDVRRDASPLLDPALQRRFQRGDGQTVGRHVLAAVASYDVFDSVTLAVNGMVSPKDGSGVGSAALTWAYSDGVTLLANAFVPWGKRPRLGRPRSEYGLSPVSGFVQIRVYD